MANEVSKKIRFQEIAQQLKKDIITYNDAVNEILHIEKNDLICCDDVNLETTKCKYPNGLPIDTIEITYCSSCNSIEEISW
jgi:hypothetical protein